MNIGKIPLNALRALYATSLHLSYTKAAKDLNVTPGAVARHIKSLEHQFDVALIVRKGPSLRLSALATELLPSIKKAFDELSSAMNKVEVASRAAPVLNLAADVSFATLWLASRLSSFRKIESDCDLRLISLLSLSNEIPSYVDIAITYSPVISDGYECELLHKENIIVVASPDTVKNNPNVKFPDDIGSVEIIKIDQSISGSPYPDWDDWFRQFKVSVPPNTTSTHMDLVTQTIEAAVSGQGYALVSETLAENHLRKGHLVCPFEADYGLELNRYLVYKQGEHRPVVQSFLRWIRTC